MKTLLLFFLLSNNPQTIIYNTPTQQFYIIELSNPIQILIIEDNITSNISCIQNKKYKLKDINFSNNSTCLMNTLNHQFNLNIQNYVDLNHKISKQELRNIKKMNISNIYKILSNIHHSYSLPDLYKIYSQAKKNEFQNEIHYLTYIKINNIYYPL